METSVERLPGPSTSGLENYDDPTNLDPCPIGLRHSEQFAVESRHTVPEVDTSWLGFQDMPPVLATAMMVAFIEQTCIMGLRPFLTRGQHTVGIQLNVGHSQEPCHRAVPVAPIDMQYR